MTLRRGSRWGLVVFLLHWSVVSATPGGQLCVMLTVSAATSARFCLWVLQPCSSDGLRGAGGDRSLRSLLTLAVASLLAVKSFLEEEMAVNPLAVCSVVVPQVFPSTK